MGGQRPNFDDVFAQDALERTQQTDGSLFGRKTYQIMAAYWPSQPDDVPFVAVLNGRPKYVASPR